MQGFLVTLGVLYILSKTHLVFIFFFLSPLGILQLSTSRLAFSQQGLLAQIQLMFTFQDITCFKSPVHQLPELLHLYPVSLVQQALLP